MELYFPYIHKHKLPTVFHVKGFLLLSKTEWYNAFHMYSVHKHRNRMTTVFHVEGFLLLNKFEWNNIFHMYTRIDCQLYLWWRFSCTGQDWMEWYIRCIHKHKLRTVFHVEGFLLLNKIEWNYTFHVYTSLKCQLYFMLKVFFSNESTISPIYWYL